MDFEINIFNDCSLKYLPIKKTIQVIRNALIGEKTKKCIINVIYVDDKEIKRINRKFLNHNRTTDVIAFNLEDESNMIEGEIYIGVETARMQAKQYGVSLTNEILRLAVHGTLHLLGYTDDRKELKEKMHNLENRYMKIR